MDTSSVMWCLMCDFCSIIVSSTLTLVALCLLCGLYDVTGYGQYRSAIPNGNKVSHPCKPNYIWKGVGHSNQLGGGGRNTFGSDFASEGHKWTRTLCEKDSDGDGQTNGFELGDPDCTWTEGATPSRAVDITHPGVCTPYDDAKCQGKNGWVSCEYAEFTCPPTQEAGVKTMDLKFPETPVPAQETTYKCMKFIMPNDTDYHLIAYEPIIANENVMHHIVLYGCNLDAPLREEELSPYTCGMTPGQGCFNFLGIWSVGTVGHCLHENFGFRFGRTKYKVMALGFHWNNPQKNAGWTDSSGMRIHYTANTRTHDAGLLIVGQSNLAIPPGHARYTAKSSCSSECTTAAMNDTIYVTSAFNHMHYMGVSQKTELIRNGVKMRDITNEEEYNYDSPVVYNFDNPIELVPGDQLDTSCVFTSKDNTKTVYWGDATSDEMCFTFLWFYPAKAISDQQCLGWKGLSTCANTLKGKGLDECHPYTAPSTDPTVMGLMRNVTEECKNVGECFPECKKAIQEAKKHTCFKGGDITDMLFQTFLPYRGDGLQFLIRFLGCDEDSQMVVETNRATVSILSAFLYVVCLTAYALKI